MASKELELQRDIVKSMRADGGYGQKISSRWQVGVPDLLLGHASWPGFALVEVKHLGEIKKLTERRVETTQPQRDHMRDAIKAHAVRTVCFTAVGFQFDGNHCLQLVGYDAEFFTPLSTHAGPACIRGKAHYYPIGNLIRSWHDGK